MHAFFATNRHPNRLVFFKMPDKSIKPSVAFPYGQAWSVILRAMA
jgi:hypothetical protein